MTLFYSESRFNLSIRILHWYRRTDTEQVKYYIALQRFARLKPISEFRCFIRHSKFIAFCSRNTAFHESLHRLVDESIRHSIRLGFYFPNFEIWRLRYSVIKIIIYDCRQFIFYTYKKNSTVVFKVRNWWEFWNFTALIILPEF